MKKIIFAAAMMIATAAHADGFVCENAEGNLRIKVYHQTQPELGTRNAAVMIVSNPLISAGRKTIATFEADDARLSSRSAVYTADVDLRFANSKRKGENIGGTKLGELDQVVLSVAYSFSQPVPAGTEVYGEVALVRRGSAPELVHQLSCTRYLKGE